MRSLSPGVALLVYRYSGDQNGEATCLHTESGDKNKIPVESVSVGLPIVTAVSSNRR